MIGEITFRMATIEDCENVLEIYAPYIINSNVTFEYEVPSIEEFRNRIENIICKYPFILAIFIDDVVGYAYAHEQYERAAYQWNVETSIYIKENYEGRGIGRILYGKLLEVLRLQNVQNVYACVTLPNEKSERLHQIFGFELVGRFHKTGYKFGRWNDIGWFEKVIGENKEQEYMTEVVSINNLLEQVKILMNEN